MTCKICASDNVQVTATFDDGVDWYCLEGKHPFTVWDDEFATHH